MDFRHLLINIATSFPRLRVAFTFDRLSDITEGFLKKKGFDRYALFVQDYGGPVGFRIVTRHPEALEWLIVQNTNAYEVGFTDAWGGLRNALWKKGTAETEKDVAGLLELDTIKAVDLHGHNRPELISPDNWNMDFRFMERPNEGEQSFATASRRNPTTLQSRERES